MGTVILFGCGGTGSQGASPVPAPGAPCPLGALICVTGTCQTFEVENQFRAEGSGSEGRWGGSNTVPVAGGFAHACGFVRSSGPRAALTAPRWSSARRPVCYKARKAVRRDLG